MRTLLPLHGLVGLLLTLFAVGAQAQLLSVSSTSPAANGIAQPADAIVITFDRAVQSSSVNGDSVRAFGRWSGSASGQRKLSAGGTVLTFTPNDPFSAGETVYVDISHDLIASDASPMRAAGYAFQFVIDVVPTPGLFEESAVIDNGANTRLYGAHAADLDNDGFLDLTTVNETSADLRVYLNRGDGTGLIEPALEPIPIGNNASPNESADFDNDGNTDLCVSAVDSDSIWILMGRGNGRFETPVEIPAGNRPRGIAPLDVDGDGDHDIAVALQDDDEIGLFINDGSGGFSGPTLIEGGVSGEYGLAAADMNLDGIRDLVVAGRDSETLNVLLGNGDATFSAASDTQSTGGRTWVVALGDVDGDGHLDASTANSNSGNAAILIGNGDGTFAAPELLSTGVLMVASDLGDLDGDGDMDWVLSSFAGGWWRIYRNDGSGSFSFDHEFEAPENASCAVLYDSDNDGDLDLALTDEIADLIFLEKNEAPAPCSDTPLVCTASLGAGKSSLDIRNDSADAKDKLRFKWGAGESLSVGEFGDPLAGDGYSLCIYEGTTLLHGVHAPTGGTCGGKPCWKADTKKISYRDKARSPHGVERLAFKPGATDGKSKLDLSGRGALLGLVDHGGLAGPLEVQLQRDDGLMCLGATFTQPFQKHDARVLKARSD